MRGLSERLRARASEAIDAGWSWGRQRLSGRVDEDGSDRADKHRCVGESVAEAAAVWTYGAPLQCSVRAAAVSRSRKLSAACDGV